MYDFFTIEVLLLSLIISNAIFYQYVHEIKILFSKFLFYDFFFLISM